MLDEGLRTPVRDPEQLKKDTALDRALYLIPYISLLIVILVCMDTLTISLYYLQDGIEKTYFENFHGGYAMSRWHLWLLMAPAAVSLLRFYPADYVSWLKQKEKEENSNMLVKKLAWTLVLIASFIVELARTPRGYTDTKILYIYHAATLGTITLTLLLNHAALYFINREKCFEYCGVSDRFSKVVKFIFGFGIAACLGTVIVTELVNSGISIGTSILSLILIVVIGIVLSAVRTWWFGEPTWWFGKRW